MLCEFDGSHEEQDSMIVHYTFDEETNQFAPTPKPAMLIKQEEVVQVFEYERDKMLVSTKHNELLVFHNWKFMRRFKDDYAKASLHGSHICPLPGFDITKFPFIAWSLSNKINIVNLTS